MYYYILIDKQNKTIQLNPYNDCKCNAAIYSKLQKDYNLLPFEVSARFAIFFNDQKDYIDFNTFHKKYSKYTVLEGE